MLQKEPTICFVEISLTHPKILDMLTPWYVLCECNVP